MHQPLTSTRFPYTTLFRSLKKTGSTIDNLAEAYCEEGIAINSGLMDSLPTTEAKQKIIAWLEEKKLGHRRVNYKLRDWLFSRDRKSTRLNSSHANISYAVF